MCVCLCHFERFRDSNYSDCMKKMCKYKNKIILDSDLKTLGVNFLARPLTSKLKIFKKIFNFEVNDLAKKSTPNAFKLLSNILTIELNYIR